ncbi:hypothetical protein GCM10025783_32950 [Amnibacterium soli]|uniref:SRPBCC family protein n=1 Tax=Amnibacterium soli TaxID=1282736 RepID=A0ABP8ZHH5_9MICO
MNLVPLIVLTAIAVVGAVIGVLMALRGERTGASGASAHDEQEQGLVRLTGEIHTGWEQTLIGLIRELRLPRDANDIAYGALYLESRSEHRMHVRTRSEIGRGFLGVIDITPRRGPTQLTYSIRRLPGDDQLHARVLDFELDLISAVRRIDANANVHLAAEALREFDRPRSAG